MSADDRSLAAERSVALLALGCGLHALPALTATGYPLQPYPLPALAPVARWLRRRLGVWDRTPERRGCALTFDDGPHPQGTPAVLEALAAAKARGTFFLVGEQVRANPALAREIAAEGHEIGLHCDRHRNLLRLTPRQLRADIDRAHESIALATGVRPTLYRPPYGILSASSLRLASRRGWRTVLWSHWGRDWEARASADSIASLATRQLRDGSVVLLHDADHYGAAGCWRDTAASLPLIFEAIAAQGLQPVSLRLHER